MQLASPGWKAVARCKAIAEAEANGEVWDGKFIMIRMPGNPSIRTLDRSKLRVVGSGRSRSGIIVSALPLPLPLRIPTTSMS